MVIFSFKRLMAICVCLSALILSLGGCGIQRLTTLVPYKHENSPVLCVAVPVFNDYSHRNTYSGEIAADLFAAELRKSGIVTLMERSDITAALAKQNIRLKPELFMPDAIWLGQMLEVDAVFVGSVEEFAYQEEQGVLVGNPGVSMQVQLVEVASKEVVWSASVFRSDHDFFNGKRDPLIRVAMLAVEELLTDLPRPKKRLSTEELLSGCGRKNIPTDLDNDKILNLADLCPNRAETVNGVEDLDGCPELVEKGEKYVEHLDVDGDRIVLRSAVKFEQGKIAIKKDSHEVLNHLGDFLKKNTQVRKVMIEGFPGKDFQGDFRERFAFRRAAFVKNFLVGLGVSEDRLVAVGYGLLERSSNTAIEFTIVE